MLPVSAMPFKDQRSATPGWGPGRAAPAVKLLTLSAMLLHHADGLGAFGDEIAQGR